MEGREHRRSLTLSEHLAMAGRPCKFGDFLKIRNDVEVPEKREASSGAGGRRTLLDVLREERERSEIEVVVGNPSDGEATANGREGSSPRRTVDSPPTEAGQPARVSLMVLLEQTAEDQWSSGREAASAAAMSALAAFLDEEEKPGPAEDIVGAGGVLHVCCICMMRPKAAAFIPCGHTFCRRCSRELWVNRGSCPLCNGRIFEILDLF
ncbi:uncharacterized protein LOC141825419 [Curcuma longa]|uniref:uncharacterized protein LOC141825419 n=1 Tax=Curcuma longa TaxID=136217 RepID=UPI003D9F2BFA